LIRRISTASTGSAAESGTDRTSILLGHIISTKTANETVTDDDMALPPNWATKPHESPELGHNEAGRTIALHSLAVDPEYQRCGLGSMLLKSYLQRMQVAAIADRCALLAHEELIPFYEAAGFEKLGKSQATYGGGGWFDMVYKFNQRKPTQPPGTANLLSLDRDDDED
jgi:ribosomal protein S18 acetylase RimI-like enzyme